MGSTRPIIKWPHLNCVETHTLSLRQRPAGEQPYDCRFAANNSDGEFLCPLCKQLSNMLIPRDSALANQDESMDVDDETITRESPTLVLYDCLCNRCSQAPGSPERFCDGPSLPSSREDWILSLTGNGFAMGRDISQPEQAAAVAPSDPKVKFER